MPRMKLIELEPHAIVRAGYIPGFLDPNDPRPAKDQIHTNYSQGGGWHAYKGFKLDPKTRRLSHPGDPPIRPYLEICFGDELVFIYPFSWVVIVQPDGAWEAARID